MSKLNRHYNVMFILIDQKNSDRKKLIEQLPKVSKIFILFSKDSLSGVNCNY